MDVSRGFDTTLILVLIAILYVQNIRKFNPRFFKSVTWSFNLYTGGFILSGLSLLGMFIFRKNIECFLVATICYLIGFYIKALGRLIYAKKNEDREMYRKNIYPFKITIFVILLVTICSIIMALLLYSFG